MKNAENIGVAGDTDGRPSTHKANSAGRHTYGLGLDTHTTDGAFHESIRFSLVSLKQEMLDTLGRQIQEIRELAAYGAEPDPADASTTDIELMVLRTLGIDEARRLRSIESALTRLREGRYGVCLRCGRRIARERLRAMPDALYCLDCQSKNERRH